MIIAQIKIRGARASVDWRKAITAGMIGAQVQIDYNDEIWDSLHKTVVFRGAVTKDVITDAEVVTIPAEVVAKHNVVLKVGVYGVDADGNLAIPTIWADLGTVRDSADPSGDTTTDPALPVWAQIQAMIGNLDELDTAAKNNLVAAVNEAMTKGGAVDEAEIRRIVADYLSTNPPTVTESDPTVPAWAKQPQKPTYTASEVGALPDTYTPPIATETTLGGVKPVTATEDMTQPVGVDAEGRLMTKPGSGGNVDHVGVEPALDDIPKIFFGGALQQTKDEKVVPFRYISKTDDFSGYAGIKAQGNSSMSYPKKNQTVKMFKDADCAEKMKVDFKGWGKQNKHCYKANWIDLTHARNVVSARLWADVVKSRTDYESLPELLRTSPNQGAVDGFPVKVYANGVYQGRYTLNIPKDKWTFNMDDNLEEHCVLCGEGYESGCFRAVSTAQWTDEIHDSMPVAIGNRWKEVITFVMNSTDEDFRANLGNYFDISSLIDYHLYGLLSCGLDAYGKNQLYLTYDGQKWIASMYDMDSTWGLYWNGSSILATDYARTSYEDFVGTRQGNLLYIRLEQLFWSELQTRWAELKNGALSIENIINRFERFTDITPADLVKEDYASTTGGGAFTGIPSKDTNNIQQIRSFALARQVWTDEYVAGLTPKVEVPCTGISLSANTLTFTAEGTQTLTATVTPDGCTESVTWESDNTSVATVNGGAVTAIANGSATITAKCGEYSASCVVSVDGIIDESIVYSLPEATTFDGTNHIDTGIKLFDEDKPFTVCLDWTHTGESAFINNTHVIAHCMKEETPWVGLIMQYTTTDINCSIKQTMLVKADVNYLSVNTQSRVRVVFTKTADGKYSVITSVDGVKMSESIGVQLTYVHISQSLLLGCYQDIAGMPGRFAKGILNDCKVYNRAISDDEITAYLS